MITQQGRVIALEGDAALVRIGAASGCPACDAGKGCGAGIFGRLLRNRPVTIQVPNSLGAEVGQPVQFGIPEQRFLALVFRMYVVPLIAGLLGAAVGFGLAVRVGLQGLAADFGALAFAIGSAGLALVWIRRRLGEFPLHATVHLVHAAESARYPICNGAGQRHDRGPAGDEFETL